MSKIHRSLYWQAGLWIVAVAACIALSRYFPMVDLVEALEQRVTRFGTGAAICYSLLFAACNMFLLPGGILAVGAGLLFGLWWGFSVVFAGNLVATAVSFMLSRSIARRWFRQKFWNTATLDALRPALERESWKIVVLSQLHPLFPTSLLNYLYGLTRIPFASYMLWASLGRIPGLFLYVYVGTVGQLGVRIMRGENYPRAVEYWIWGGVLATTILLLVVLGRVAYRAIQSYPSATKAIRDGSTDSAPRMASR